MGDILHGQIGRVDHHHHHRRAVGAALKAKGYTDADIVKLWSGNVLRVWQAAIDAAKTAS